jgi:hypothetical protein
MQQMPPRVVKWAQEGKALSEMRPGKVDPLGGSPRDYRSLMTEISADDLGRYNRVGVSERGWKRREGWEGREKSGTEVEFSGKGAVTTSPC